MPGLSAWAVRRPVIALIAWFVSLVAMVGLGLTVGGKLNDSFDLPDTESTAAMELLQQAGRSEASLQGEATVVWSGDPGQATDPAVLRQVLPVLEGIATLSTVCTLEPGTIISTGTPPGVGVFRDPPRFLTPGDTVRVEIDGIGAIENPVVPEP